MIGGFLLEQNVPFTGLHRVYASDSVFVCQAVKSKFFLQFIAANKMVTIWRPDSHEYAVLPYQEWLQKFPHSPSTLTWTSELTKPLDCSGKYLEHIKYCTYHFRVDTNTPSFWSSDVGKLEKSHPSNVTLTTACLPVCPQAKTIIERIYGLPSHEGIPCEAKYIAQPGVTSVALETKLKPVQSNPIILFKVTPAYKKVPFSLSLLLPHVDEMLNGFMGPK